MAEQADLPTPELRRPAVGVVLVNYCTADLTIECLASLEAEIASRPGSTVVVVDNASPDASGPAIGRAVTDRGWSEWAKVLLQSENGGFSYGNNAGMRDLFARASAPEFVWLLNTDTLVHPGAMDALADFLEANPRVGIVGSQLEYADASEQCSVFRFHSIAGEFESNLQIGAVSRLLSPWVVAPAHPTAPAPVDWVSGASMMVRRQVIDEVGFFDEGYFLYYEETDLCLRASRKGWTCWFIPESRVLHYAGQSTGVTYRASVTRRRPAYWYKSRRRYFIKNHGVTYAAIADMALALGAALSLVRDPLRGRARSSPDKLFSDLLRQSALLNPKLESTR